MILEEVGEFGLGRAERVPLTLHSVSDDQPFNGQCRDGVDQCCGVG